MDSIFLLVLTISASFVFIDQFLDKIFALVDFVLGECLVVAILPFAFAVTKAPVVPIVTFLCSVIVVDCDDVLPHFGMEYVSIF